MRIAQVIHQFLPQHQHGSEIYTYNLCRELNKHHEVSVFCREDINGPVAHRAVESYEGLPVHRIYYSKSYSFEDTYKNTLIEKYFEEFLIKTKPDVIHFQHLERLSATLAYVAQQKGVPSVLTLHDYWFICPGIRLTDHFGRSCFEPYSEEKCSRCLSALPEVMLYQLWQERQNHSLLLRMPVFKKSQFNEKLIKKLSADNQPSLSQIKRRFTLMKDVLRIFSAIISPSGFLRERFIAFGVPKDRIIHCDYGFPPIASAKASLDKDSQIKFGFIGAVAKHKGLHLLIEAFRQIKEKDCELKIFGRNFADSYFSGIKRSIEKDERISYIDGFEHKMIADVLSQIDVLVVPSVWQENSPLVIHEAMARKIPVITACAGGMPELVTHLKNGLLFSTNDAKDLRQKIEEIVRRPALTGELRENCPAPKDIKTNAEEMEQLYLTVS